MSSDNFERIVLENYENEFSYKKNKSNLNITFNRIAFIFFIFLIISVIFSSKAIYLGKKEIDQNKIKPNRTYFRASIVDIY